MLCDIRDKARTTNDLVSEKIAQVRAQEQSHDDVDESADKGEDKAAEKGSDWLEWCDLNNKVNSKRVWCCYVGHTYLDLCLVPTP